MEDHQSKLPSNKKSLFYLIEISKYTDQLKSKLKRNNRSTIESSDLHTFKELCTSNEPKMSSVACETVINFVKNNTFPQTQALTWFIAVLQSDSGNNVDRIIQAIADIFLLTNKVSFNLCSPQHPFILLLKQKEQNWSKIEFQMIRIFKSKHYLNDVDLFNSLRPVFQYILWSPTAVSSACRKGAWKLFIDNFRSEYLEFLVQTISWLPSNDLESIVDINYFLNDYETLDKRASENNICDIICLYYAYISCKLAKHGYDPVLTLETTKILLKKYPATTDIVLVLIAQTLVDCPASYLNIFLITCVDLIKYNSCGNIAILWLLVSSILSWLIHTLSFLEDFHKTAEILFAMVDDSAKNCKKRTTSHFNSDEYFMQVIISEEDMFWAYVTTNSLEHLNHEPLLDRINEIYINREEIAKYPLFHLCISAIFLRNETLHMQTKALDLLMRINPGFQLPLVLYALARSPNPRVQLKLLHALPFTAIEKDNISPVLRTIDSLFSSKKRILMLLSVELYITLWRNEERCYSYLHDRLLEFEELQQEHIWETDVVLVSAIRSICTFKPEKHGKEWISILNEIIKRWHKKNDGSVPSTLALDAILMLCKADVLKVTSIYQLLSERLFDDRRTEVSKKFCALIQYMFETTKNEDFEDSKTILLEAVSKLWKIISSSSSEKEVVFAAMNALLKFDKNEMTASQIPPIYLKHVKFPCLKEGEKEYIPGDVWIEFLKYIHHDIKSKACDMLIHWLREEVENFPRSYYASIRGEPKDLNYIHNRFIYKALIKYLKNFLKKSNSYHDYELEMSVMCLKILNGNLGKTLPLHNWSFLLELLEIQQFSLTEQILILFAKQSRTSSSARICIEDYLKNFDISKKENELKVILNTINDLCCGVSTVVLKKFLEVVENYIINNIIIGDKNLLLFICDRFKNALQNSEIEDNNRICISESLETFWENTPHDSDAFPKLIEVAVELPITYIEHLCSPSVMWEMSPEKVRKLLKLRCAMALKPNNEDPFSWLQECIETTANYLEEEDLYFQYSLKVIKQYRSNPSWQWLLRYMSFIHSNINELPGEKMNFFCDVFIFSIVTLSIYEPFVSNYFCMEECYRFFPQALHSLTTQEVSSQVIEWLRYIRDSSKIDEKRRRVFYNGILSFKNTSYMSNNLTWCKIVT